MRKPDTGDGEQTVWIARHANRMDFVDPDWRHTARRPHDPGLAPDGVVQAKRLGRRLVGQGIAHIFVSPFLRAVETAHHIGQLLDLPISIEHGAGEWLNPDWYSSMPELLPIEEMAELFPRIDRDYASLVMPRYPETFRELMERAGETARRLVQDFPDSLLVVGHLASVVGLTAGLLDRSPEIECPLCCLVKLVHRSGRWVMELNGDTSHLWPN